VTIGEALDVIIDGATSFVMREYTYEKAVERYGQILDEGLRDSEKTEVYETAYFHNKPGW